MSKVFVIDIAKCNGCHNCQVACKDEHCEQSWMPYAQAQPLTGQFWCKVNEKEHGQVPVVRLSYTPVLGAQDDAIKEYAPECCQEREDGLIVLDPEKCKGRKDIADKFDGVFWNEELEICQGCTGCAHLIDNDWEEPRCVDACCTDALRYVEESEVDLTGAEKRGNVYYLNVPKRFIAGLLYDPEVDEVVIGATVVLMLNGEQIAETVTDDFGDYRFVQIEPGAYELVVSAKGFETKTIAADCTEQDIYVGDEPLAFIDDRRFYPSAADIARRDRAEAVIKWAEMRRDVQMEEDEVANFAVDCPCCGKHLNVQADSGIYRCQFCKADLTEVIAEKAAELAAK